MELCLFVLGIFLSVLCVSLIHSALWWVVRAQCDRVVPSLGLLRAVPLWVSQHVCWTDGCLSSAFVSRNSHGGPPQMPCHFSRHLLYVHTMAVATWEDIRGDCEPPVVSLASIQTSRDPNLSTPQTEFFVSLNVNEKHLSFMTTPTKWILTRQDSLPLSRCLYLIRFKMDCILSCHTAACRTME